MPQSVGGTVTKIEMAVRVLVEKTARNFPGENCVEKISSPERDDVSEFMSIEFSPKTVFQPNLLQRNNGAIPSRPFG